MVEAITWVGIDAHKKRLSFCVVRDSQRQEYEVPNEAAAVRRIARKLTRQASGEVRCCYEAGPCGYALKREMESAAPDLICEVVAPSLIPVKSGDRVKTDKRDARKLAQYLAAGLLTEVTPPSEEQEGVRDLTRCRRALKGDLMRSRHRLSKLLLRRGIRYTAGKKAWTTTYHKWLQGLRFDNSVDQIVLDQYRLGIEQLTERIAHVDAELQKVSQQDAYRDAVGWLRCFRGIDTVAAMTILAEVHDFQRFRTPLQLMAYLGLTPSENSSGDGDPKRGPITKTGNTHARRVLVEVSWHYRHRAGVGKKLAERRRGQPSWAIATADKAQLRLTRRYQRMVARGKPPQKAVVAVARELVGFIWATVLQGTAQQSATHSLPNDTTAQGPCKSRAVTDLASVLPTGSSASPVKGKPVTRRTCGQHAKSAPALTPEVKPKAARRASPKRGRTARATR
jgi:transposase